MSENFDASPNSANVSSSPPPPPPETSRSKLRKPWFTVAIIVGVLAVPTIFALWRMSSTNAELLPDYAATHHELVERYDEAEVVIDKAGDLHGSEQTRLKVALNEADDALEAPAPTRFDTDLQARITVIDNVYDSLDRSTTRLEEAIASQQAYEENIPIAEEALSAGQAVLEDAQEISDDAMYAVLAEEVSRLESLLDQAPDGSVNSVYEPNGSLELLDSAEQVARYAETVDAQQEDVAAADAIEYEPTTAQKWQAVADDPDAYAGEYFEIYGVVTRDPAVGTTALRLDTGATEQSAGDVYPVETVARRGRFGMLEDVSLGDHLRMRVEVDGAEPIATDDGGSRDVLFIRLDEVEIIGQF